MTKALKPFAPKRFLLTCTVPSDPRDKVRLHSDGFTFRVAATDDRDAIPGLIAEDKKEARNTFGGLIEPGQVHARTYRLFEASWAEIPLAGVGSPKGRG